MTERTYDFEEPTFDPSPTPPQLRVLRIIVSCLVLGVSLFAIVSIVVPATSGGGLPLSTLRGVAALLLAVNIVGALLVRRGLAHGCAPDTSDELLMSRFFVATLIGSALLEGAALFAVVIHLLGRNPLDLLIAAVAVLLILAVFFPTDGRWRRFVQSVRRRDAFPGPER